MSACTDCDASPDRTIMGHPYCNGCAEMVLAPIRAKVNRADGAEGFAGIGRPDTPASPDWPGGWWNLLCDLCSAGWVGLEGEACPFCDRASARMLDEQRRLLLRADLPDDDDRRRPAAIAAWIDRLAVAVAAGIVDEDEARRAVERHEVRDAAA